MKRGLFLFFISSFFFSSNAQITWDGGAGTPFWDDAANWSTDVVPAPTDDVLLDNSVVPGSYVVNLPSGAVTVSVNTLAITPTIPNAIRLILPNSNIAEPGLSIAGPGDAMIINRNGIFQNSSGASASPVFSITNTFRINNGGRYIHSTPRGNAAIVSQLSSVAGTENGTFQFDVPVSSHIISLSGRTFGNLELSSTEYGASVTYPANGGMPVTVNGNLLINASTTLTVNFTNDIIVNGNLVMGGASFFNLSNGTANTPVKVKGNITSNGAIMESGTGLPQLQLNGTVNQNITVIGTITNSVTLNINNAAGATLLSTLTLPYHLELTNGRLNTSSLQLLTLLDNATSSAGSSGSFVNGPMRKIGNDNFVFPVGTGSIYAPLGITNVSGELTGDQFTAEYKRANPQSTTPYGPGVGTGLDHVSYVEYWTLEQNTGTSTKNVSLDVHLESFCRVLSSTYVTRWDGLAWSRLATTITFGPTVISGYEIGTIASTAGASGFIAPQIAFTLATDLNFSANPLPINLIAFDASKLSSTKALLNWELSACCSSSAKFELQRAGAAKNFRTIATIGGSETNRYYNYTDNDLQSGINYYRLKMTDADGTVSYSKTVAVLNGAEGLLLTSLIPTIVSGTASLTIASSASQKMDILIVDMQGRLLWKQNWQLTAGSTTVTIATDQLAAGTYQLFGVSSAGKTNVIRFIKQ
ncbi:MAG: T9SS type A sorting domain-containing protein [Chitinophagaceae bacterium]|nr:T9SS type A sorting domain-containing protein [Chitinophagaceae bacterium]